MKYRRQSGISQFDENVFCKGAQGITKVHHTVLLLLKFLQTKLQANSLIIKYYDL